jgi:sulfatase maturation enzyme AslB (radical SAM superfamily)
MFKFKLFGIDATFHEEDFSLIYEGEKYFYSTEVIDNEDKAVYFKLNNKCNLKCVYCFQKEEVDNKISLNLMHYKNLIEHLFLEYNSFKFFGGEPFI